MIVTLQYPIANCRLLLHSSYKLPKPYFAAGRARQGEYVRWFGSMKDRHNRNYYYCAGENLYCSARAVRLEAHPSFYVGKAARLSQYQSRFYSDGNIMGKFEIKAHYSIRPENIATDTTVLESVLDLHFSQRAYINNRNGGVTETELSAAGKELSRLYLYGSTPYGSIDKTQPYWIAEGVPMILVELFGNYPKDIPRLPATAREVKGTWHEDVKIFRHDYRGIPCWIILKRENSDEVRQTTRTLRTLLLRIHAEKQSLIRSLEFISINRENTGVDTAKAVKYVKRTVEKLLNGRRFNLEQCPLVDSAFGIDDQFSGEDYSRLRQVINDLDNKYLTEDFGCLFAQIDFDKLALLYAEYGGQLPNELKEIGTLSATKNRLGLKKLFRKNNALVTGLGSNALFEMIKYVLTAML